VIAQTDNSEPHPPLTPEGEEIVPASASFLQACHASSSDMIAWGGWELGNQLFTQSGAWGTIWRADFKIPGSDFLVNRIVCWQTFDGKFNVMFAIGQSVPPLG
jgi:hypothetical protein